MKSTKKLTTAFPSIRKLDSTVQLRAELSGGPPSLHFCGRQWLRGQPQPVTPELWAQMRSRNAAALGFTLTKENDDV